MNEEKISMEKEREGAALRTPKKRFWKTALLGILIFVCGIVTGSGLTLVIARRMIIRMLKHPEQAPARVTARLERALHLSEDQTRQIREIVVRRLGNLYRIRQETHPRVREELELLKKEVGAVLNEKQRKIWKERFEKLEKAIPAPPPPAQEPL